MSVTQKLAAAGHLTPEQAARVTERVRSFKTALAHDSSLRKQADGFFSRVGQRLGPTAEQTLAHAIAAGSLGLGVSTGAAGVQAVIDHVRKARAYKAMIDANPELADANLDRVQALHNSLYRVNPQYARDPLIAGEFVKGLINQAQIPMQAFTSTALREHPNQALEFATKMLATKVPDKPLPTSRRGSPEDAPLDPTAAAYLRGY